MTARPLCWAMTTGEAGMVSQAMGLAEAVGIATIAKRVGLRAPWRWLPGHRCPAPLAGLDGLSDRLAPPWPDLLITCGRRSVALAIEIRRRSGGRVFTVHIQAPRVPCRYFDLVIVPRHDRLQGPNVHVSRAALHRITPALLAAEAARLGPGFAALPRPLVAVLVGGTSRAYRLTPAIATRLAKRLAALCRDHGVGLMVTVSRRTGAENTAILRDHLAGLPCRFWDGAGDNPYFAMLGLADAVIVTADSISMISEACATGKPVHIIELEGGNRRFADFHRMLREDGITRPFDGTLAGWSYAPLDCTAVAARAVRARLAGLSR
jgi:uncharacterized protein